MNRRTPAPHMSTFAVIAWVVGLLGSAAVLWTIPIGPSPGSLVAGFDVAAWLDRTDPTEMAATLVRFGALAWTLWLSVVTVTGLALRAVGAATSAARLFERLPEVGRRARRPVAGVALATTLTVGATVTAGAQAEPSAGTDQIGTRATATLTHVGEVGWPRYDYPVTPADLGDADVAPGDGTPSSQRPGIQGSWLVEEGDNLWSIAERTAPSGSDLNDIARHWLGIIDANRDSLPRPDDPDLIYPGMTITIPSSDNPG